MKKLVFSAFIAFWASIATLVALQVLATDQSEKPTVDRISREVLATHSTEKDCWIAVEGKVYDITAYIPNHPAPLSVLLTWCGKEATNAMRTKGYGRDHSSAAWNMLNTYFVGGLVD